jgi:transcriptional regulator with XRE-family HTH domain
MDTPRAETMQRIVAGEVRAWLARRQRSGRSAALELGWTEPYLSRRLTGAVQFDVADLAKLAELLDVPVTVFFDGPALVPSLPDAPVRKVLTSTPVFPFRTQGALAA